MTNPSAEPAGLHDFDFLHGYWRVRHRRLNQRLAGSTDWEEFDGLARVWPLMNGVVNVDENKLPGGEWVGVSVRTFDLAAGRWSICWVSPRDGLLQAPMQGGFEQDLGTFFGQEDHQGRSLPCRYRWSNIRTPQPRWEQALRLDGGQSWETNWTMTLTRMEADEY